MIINQEPVCLQTQGYVIIFRFREKQEKKTHTHKKTSHIRKPRGQPFPNR